MATTDGETLTINRGEIYNILRLAQTDWFQVKALIDNIGKREGVPAGAILVEARDEAGSNALHYAAMKGNAAKSPYIYKDTPTLHSPIPKIPLRKKTVMLTSSEHQI